MVLRMNALFNEILTQVNYWQRHQQECYSRLLQYDHLLIARKTLFATTVANRTKNMYSEMVC